MASSIFSNLVVPESDGSDDLDIVCRLCLRNNNDLVDLFEAGMSDKIIEITRLELDICDDLPKKVCSECKKKVEETYDFVCKVKTVDHRLRSFLSVRKEKKAFINEEDPPEPDANKLIKENKLFLIVVSNSGAESTLSPEVSGGLNHGCLDHTYSKEVVNPVVREETKNYGQDHDSSFYTCSRCNRFFAATSEFLSHVNTCYDEDSEAGRSTLVCPVCRFSETDNDLYTEHLRMHESEGLTFLKFNFDNEGSSIENPSKTIERKLLKICLKGCGCEKCGKYLVSLKSFVDHEKECHGVDFENEGKLCLVYTCPICRKDQINDRTGFVKHLYSHKKDGVNFVKVDGLGNPVPVKKSEKVFLNMKKAKEIITRKESLSGNASRDQSKTYEESDSTAGHFFYCPICRESVGTGISDDAKRSCLFYDHLARHDHNPKADEDAEKGSGFLLDSSEKHSASFDVIMPKAALLEKPPYVCDLCSGSFRSKNEIAKHLRLHTDEGRALRDFVCERCGLKCTGRVSYEKHFSRHSSDRNENGKRPTCGFCRKTFANRRKLGEHSKQHDEEGWEDGNGLGVAQVVCEICGMRFSKNSGLSKHKKLHLTDKENSFWKCKLCDRNFSNQKTFDRHLAAHLNPNYFECEVCKLPLPSASGLRRHSETHKIGSVTHDCNVCNLSFLSKEALTCHRAHTGHVSGLKPMECNVCHEKFYVGKEFARHIKMHPKYKTTECTLCRKRLSTFQSLALHMDRHFESNGILCPHCGKRFFEERNYRRHLLTHEGIRPFSCDVQGCQKSFYTLFEIKRHKKYHFDTRDFDCPYCSKKFHEANHLKVHIRTHTGEKPYVCPHCHKGFVTRTRCKQHIKLIHQGVGYDLIRTDISKKVTVFESVPSLS